MTTNQNEKRYDMLIIGGGDERLRDMIFRDNVPDPLGHTAGTVDGAYSIIVGVAAYALAAVKIKVVTREDCLLLPKGEKIAKLLKL